MKYEDLLQQFASLSESDADAALKAAGSDKRYKLELAGLLVAYILGIVAVSLAVPAFYSIFQPGIWFRSFLAVAALVGIWLSVHFLRLVIHRFYWQAIVRHFKVASVGP